MTFIIETVEQARDVKVVPDHVMTRNVAAVVKQRLREIPNGDKINISFRGYEPKIVFSVFLESDFVIDDYYNKIETSSGVIAECTVVNKTTLYKNAEEYKTALNELADSIINLHGIQKFLNDNPSEG